jgi:hypothetical protein
MTAADQKRQRQADYMRQYRAKGPGLAYARTQNEAYRAAQARLRELHRAEFDALYADERRARGLA